MLNQTSLRRSLSDYDDLYCDYDDQYADCDDPYTDYDDPYGDYDDPYADADTEAQVKWEAGTKRGKVYVPKEPEAPVSISHLIIIQGVFLTGSAPKNSKC